MQNKTIFFLYFLVGLVYLVGLFIPLMENDSAQHASMAMKMVLNNDFLHIYKGNAPYLDKPHLHFWFSAWSMQLFGINQVAYRLPALLFLALGAFYTFKLSKLLYPQSGHIAALLFLVSQTIILSGHDVRTDAVMTGAVIIGVYNLVAFLREGKWVHAVGGGLGMAMALGSKGMVGVGIIGLFVLCYLLYSREWRGLLRWNLALVVLSFVLGIAPVVYAYYVQFDLNPDLIVHGRQGVSGVRFILWDQSFNRFSGDDFGATNSDYLFFFHSLLWMFIPFSLPLYGAIFRKSAGLLKHGFKRMPNYEFLTIGGFWTVMLVFSFSEFKLPHYLNSMIPMLSVLGAAYLMELYRRESQVETKVYLFFHCLLIAAGLALIGYISGVAFPPQNGFQYFALVLVGLGMVWLVRMLFSKHHVVVRYIYSGVLFAVTLNLFLNSQLYPALAQYQAGWQVARELKADDGSLAMSPDEILLLDHYTNWTLDFYTATNIRRVPEREVALLKGQYLLVKSKDLERMQGEGLETETLMEAYQYRITQVKPAFLNPDTREAQLEFYQLVKIL